MKKLLAVLLFCFSSPATALDFQCWDAPGNYTFNWPSGVNSVVAEVCGEGASGGSSIYEQLAGGGGSGARVVRKIPRPASGSTAVRVGPGAAGLAANSANNIYGQPLGNPGGTDALLNPHTGERDSTYFGADLRCWGATGGQNPSSNGPGGDGGTPGICSAAPPYIYTPGGMGGASPPIVPSTGLNHSMPYGADSPCGGTGGNNGQGGQYPGGGGSPGNRSMASGEGARGRVCVWW